MDIKDRINHIIQVESLTPSRFADIIGVQRSNISHILSGRNKPSLDFILKVLEQFPHINSDWLIKGDQTEMPLSSNSENEPSQLQFDEEEQATYGFENSSALNGSKTDNMPTVDQSQNKNAKEISLKQEKTSTNYHSNNNLDANSKKRIKRIIVFYDDNSFEEFSSMP